eukprot:scaffold65933_cov57-Phaeocystis_antarctica.AAC.1
MPRVNPDCCPLLRPCRSRRPGGGRWRGAEEDGVDGARVDRAHVGGDHVRAEEDEDGRVDGLVAAGAVSGVGVERVEAEGGAQHRVGPCHEEAEEALDDLVDADLAGVAQHELEGLLARPAEGAALDGDVDVAVEADELDGLLEAPHAALHALHGQLEQAVLVLRVLRHRVEELHAQPQRLAQRDHEGTHGERAEVLARDGPGRAGQPREAGARLAALVLRAGRVVVGEPVGNRARHGGPRDGRDPIDEPQHDEDAVGGDGGLLLPSDLDGLVRLDLGPDLVVEGPHDEHEAHDQEAELDDEVLQAPDHEHGERAEDLCHLLDDGDAADDLRRVRVRVRGRATVRVSGRVRVRVSGRVRVR